MRSHEHDAFWQAEVALRSCSYDSAECIMIRAAIVGLGRWGRSLVRSVQGKSDEIEFILAHTRTPATAKEFCRDHNIALVDSYDDILRDAAVDAVVLATPHGEHAQQTMGAASAGKHHCGEKPNTLERPSAEAAVSAAGRAGRL